jgi:hypothetical protein
MNLERRADHEQQPRLSRERERTRDRALREQLAEEDDVRLEDGAALRTLRRRRLLEQREDARELVPRPAPRARRGADRAVHLDHLAAAGARVEQVDVLRHDRPHEPRPLEPRQREMRVVRLGLGQHREARRVEAPHLLGIAAERVDRAVLERVELRPQAGRRAEVGHAALGRHTGAAQDDARLPVADEVSEATHGHAFSRGDFSD